MRINWSSSLLRILLPLSACYTVSNRNKYGIIACRTYFRLSFVSFFLQFFFSCLVFCLSDSSQYSKILPLAHLASWIKFISPKIYSVDEGTVFTLPFIFFEGWRLKSYWSCNILINIKLFLFLWWSIKLLFKPRFVTITTIIWVQRYEVSCITVGADPRASTTVRLLLSILLFLILLTRAFDFRWTLFNFGYYLDLLQNLIEFTLIVWELIIAGDTGVFHAEYFITGPTPPHSFVSIFLPCLRLLFIFLFIFTWSSMIKLSYFFLILCWIGCK